MKNIDVCIISPSLVETGSNRGCGCEVTDYHVALMLSRTMKTAIICPFFEKYVKNNKINDNFSILNMPFPAQKKYPPTSTTEIIVGYALCYIYSIFVAFKLISLSRFGLKIIIVHNPQTGLLASVVARMLGIDVILAEGNITPWADPYVYATKLSSSQIFIQQLSLKMMVILGKISSSIRAQSNSIKSGMTKNGINPEKICVIPAGIDLNEFSPSSETYNDIFNVGFVGRLSDVKGVPLLIKVIELAETKLPNVIFSVFGEGPYKQQLKEYSNIDHLGSVPRSSLNVELEKIQAVLFFQTELGRAEIESMAAGKAIIACNTGEMRDVLVDGHDSILCDPRPEEYVRAIDLLRVDSELLRKISSNARAKAADLYSWDSVAIQWEFMCQKLLNRDTAATHG